MRMLNQCIPALNALSTLGKIMEPPWHLSKQWSLHALYSSLDLIVCIESQSAAASALYSQVHITVLHSLVSLVFSKALLLFAAMSICNPFRYQCWLINKKAFNSRFGCDINGLDSIVISAMAVKSYRFTQQGPLWFVKCLRLHHTCCNWMTHCAWLGGAFNTAGPQSVHLQHTMIKFRQ